MALYDTSVEELGFQVHDQYNNNRDLHEVINNGLAHQLQQKHDTNNNNNNHAEDDLHINHTQLPTSPPIGHYHSSPELWPTTFRKSMDAYSIAVSPKATTFWQWCKKIKGKKKRVQSTHEAWPHPSPLTTNHDHVVPNVINNHLYLHDNHIREPLLDKGPTLVSQSPSLEEGLQHPHIRENYEGSIKEVINEEEELKKEATTIENGATEKATFWETMFHGINVMAGIGLLSCPYALKEGGWLGLLVLVMFATICCYTGHLLRKCIDSEPQDNVTSYPDIAQLAFGKIGRTFISVVLYAELYSYCVEFIILEGDHLSKFYPNFNISYDGIHINSAASFAMISTLIVLLTVCIRNVKLLSVLSFLGVSTSFVVLLLVAWLGVVNQVGVERTSSPSYVNWKDLPIAVGVFGFCYSGHGVFPNIYHSMKDKTRYTTVLVSSFFLCTFLYGGMAVIGFLMFQEQTLSQITLNVPKGYIASYIVLLVTIINPFTKFALIIAPIVNGIEELIPTHKLTSCQRTIVSIVIRVLIVLSCLFVATLVPFFSYLMAFVGSAISMLVVAIIPCACYLKIYKGTSTKSEVTISILIMGVGLVSTVIGTYSSITKIYSSF